MSYDIFIDLASRAVAIAVGVYFIAIWLFAGSRYRIHSFVLVVYSAIYYFMPSLDQTSLTYTNSYMQDVGVSMMIEGAAGFAMVACLFFDRLTGKHAIILAFAVLVHSMVYCHLQGSPTWITPVASGFYYLYDELIILVGLMQMVTSYNGIITTYHNSLRNLQRFILRLGFYSDNLHKSLSARKTRENKT